MVTKRSMNIPWPPNRMLRSPLIRTKLYSMVWEESRKACSRTSSSMPGWSGSTTSSPVASREKATRPGPWATLMMNGMPASARLTPPVSGSTLIRVASSFQSSTWCSKKIESPAPEVDLGDRHDLPLHLAGAGAELDLRHVAQARRLAPPRVADQSLTSSGAPHDRQVSAVPSFMLLHHWHSIRTSGSLWGCGTGLGRCWGWGSVMAGASPVGRGLL